MLSTYMYTYIHILEIVMSIKCDIILPVYIDSEYITKQMPHSTNQRSASQQELRNRLTN
jgi:hypothetical protein